MHAKSKQTHVLTFRVDNQVWAKILAAVEAQNSTSETVSHYCQQVISRWAFRHDRHARWNDDTKRIVRELAPPLAVQKKREARFQAPLRGLSKRDS